jgi:hypothetical protein
MPDLKCDSENTSEIEFSNFEDDEIVRSELLLLNTIVLCHLPYKTDVRLMIH